MTLLPTTRSRAWLMIGLALALVHLTVLCGIALFDKGAVADHWLETMPWLIIVAMPAVLAGAGFRNPASLPWTAGTSLPLAFLSLAGATLPLLLPALFYVLACAAASRSPIEAQ